MADHGEAGHSVNLFVVIQDIREPPVHLVGLTGTGRIAAPAVALRRDLLTLGGDEMLVGGNVFLYDCCTAVKPGLTQTIQYDRRVLDTLPEQAVDNAGVATELCGSVFSAF